MKLLIISFLMLFSCNQNVNNREETSLLGDASNFDTDYSKTIYLNKPINGDSNSLSVIFLEDFEDTLVIKLNDSFIIRDYFKTNASTGSCLNTIEVFTNKKKNLLTIRSNNSDKVFKAIIDSEFQYLYLRKYFGHWSPEFTDKALELE